MNFQEPLSGLFERIARAIERLGPRAPERPNFGGADAFVWQAEREAFLPVKEVNRVPLALLKGIDAARDTLIVEHTPIDYLDFASPVSGLGSKMGIDATNKWPGETTREWGRPIVMDEAVKQRVDALWDQLGL